MPVILPLQIDLGATPHYQFECELDGATYSFDFCWNDRDGSWYMQVGDGVGNLLAGARRCVLGVPLLVRFRDSRLPPGQLLCVDTGGKDVDAGLSDLGSRVQIWYYAAAELKAA